MFIPNFVQINSVVVELNHADRQTGPALNAFISCTSCTERIKTDVLKLLWSPGSSVNIVSHWTTGRSRFDPRQGQRIFPLTSVSRLAPRPIQSPAMGTEGPLPGAKRSLGVTLTTRPYLMPRSRMSRSYIPLPPSATMACIGTALLCLKLLRQL
jgi:hypothetical protein